MGLVELILTVCSLSQPGQCSDQHLQFVDQGYSLRQCLAEAQPYMAQWSNSHPNVQIVKWRCAYPEREQAL